MRSPHLAIVLFAVILGCETPTEPIALVYLDRPVVVQEEARGWRAVSVGGTHTCGIRLDGALFCWGANASGQLGLRATRGQCGRSMAPCEAAPRAVSVQARFDMVSAGDRHTCGITSARALYCWGESVEYQTGVEGAVFVATPTPVAAGLQFIDVAAGSTHTCAVRTNGVVYCWGEGRLGALGRGDTVSSVFPQPIGGAVRFTTVRSGRWRSCGIAVDATVWCWGSEWEETKGALDFFHERLVPQRVSGLPPMQALSVSGSSLCGSSVDGEAFCWESNGFGQLGTGDLEGSTSPRPVSTRERFSGVSAGVLQSCGTTIDARALCWGNNSFGQLGVPRPGTHCGEARLDCSTTPIPVFGRLRFQTVATGLGVHSCGVTTDTAIVCWGLGGDGQLGDGFTRDRQSLPVSVLAPVP